MQLFRRYVYADAAASTPLSRAVKRELKRLITVYGNAGALHDLGLAAKREMDAARESVAHAIGAHADEIYFVSGGTEANNLALLGTLRPLLRTRGEVQAITSAIEHPSVLEVFAELEEEGLYTVALSVDDKGALLPGALEEIINDETALISVQLINSEIGTIQDLHAITKTARHVRKERLKAGNTLPLYVHTDASQAPLWMKLDVDKLGIDLMTLDGQKIMGPKGVGVLYVRRGVEISPVLWGGGQEKGLRSGTENVLLAGTFAAALALAQEDAVLNARAIAPVRDYLYERIRTLFPDAILNGAEGEGRVANNCNVSIPGLPGEMAVIALNRHGVACSTRSACSTGEEAPSHVLEAIGLPKKAAQEAIRLTLLPNATIRDADFIAAALKKVAERYKNVLK